MRTPVAGRPARTLSPRLLLAGAGFLVAVVPAALLAYLISRSWQPLHELDHGVADALHTWAVSRPGAVRFLDWVSIVLHPQVLRVVSIAVAGWLLLRGQRRLALWVVVTAVGSGVVDTVLKDAVHRARPVFPHPVAEASGYSFPSGHALGTSVMIGMALLLVLPLLHRPAARVAAWVLAVGLVALVGFARVGLGLHYVSDVLAGWLVGFGWLAVTAAAFESWRRGRGRPPRAAGDVLHEGVEPAGSRLAVRR